MVKTALVLLLGILLGGCTTAPPRNIDNICSIFRQYPKWYWAAQDVQKKWRVPISVLMAIMHQESKFRAGAKPPRRKLLWIIPFIGVILVIYALLKRKTTIKFKEEDRESLK